jgi:hypothetical protein
VSFEIRISSFLLLVNFTVRILPERAQISKWKYYRSLSSWREANGEPDQRRAVFPSGEIIANGPVGRKEIVVPNVEWDRVNEPRTHWSFLRDRRVDAYAGIEQQLLD